MNDTCRLKTTSLAFARRFFIVAMIGTVGIIGAIGAGPAEAQSRSTVKMLQEIVRDFDRQSLEANITLEADEGELRPGIRCATRPIADFEQQFIDSAATEYLRAAGTEHRMKDLVVPVHFHILRQKNGGWNVTDAQIAEQLEVLNRSFGTHGFTFTLDGVSRRNKNKFARKCLKESVETKFKKRYAVDPSTTLNFYTCRPKQDVLGYANFPSDYPEDSFMHGVVLLHSTLPGGNATPFDLGDTAVHEVGHYLGLLHTFEGKCGKKGDRISDTPRERSPATGCPFDRDTCPQAGLDPVRNFMDYTDDLCIEEFTPEQGLWMKDQVATFKPSLGASGGL
jgi:hypothetical protein